MSEPECVHQFRGAIYEMGKKNENVKRREREKEKSGEGWREGTEREGGDEEVPGRTLEVEHGDEEHASLWSIDEGGERETRWE